MPNIDPEIQLYIGKHIGKIETDIAVLKTKFIALRVVTLGSFAIIEATIYLFLKTHGN